MEITFAVNRTFERNPVACYSGMKIWQEFKREFCTPELLALLDYIHYKEHSWRILSTSNLCFHLN